MQGRGAEAPEEAGLTAPDPDVLAEIRVASEERAILGTADLALAAVRDAGFSGRGEPRLKLAIIELLTNAIEHGNGFDAAKAVTVAVRRDGPDRLLVTIADEGPGLDPRRLERDLAQVDLSAKRGRGHSLVKKILGAPPRLNARGNEVTIAFDRERFA